MILSPGLMKFEIEASIPAVPEPATVKTSWLVWKSHLRPVRTFWITGMKSGERWWIMGADIASRTSGGTGVGPGAKRYCFFMDVHLLENRVTPSRQRRMRPQEREGEEWGCLGQALNKGLSRKTLDR